MRYRIRWQETSEHDVVLSAERLAEVKGVTVEALAEMDRDALYDGLEDQLAEVSDEAFDGLTRDHVDVEEVD